MNEKEFFERYNYRYKDRAKMEEFFEEHKGIDGIKEQYEEYKERIRMEEEYEENKKIMIKKPKWLELLNRNKKKIKTQFKRTLRIIKMAKRIGEALYFEIYLADDNKCYVTYPSLDGTNIIPHGRKAIKIIPFFASDAIIEDYLKNFDYLFEMLFENIIKHIDEIVLEEIET